MAASSSKHIRSISLPSRPHPGIESIEEELKKLRTLETTVTPTVETISEGLLSLEELHKCVDDLLSLPQTLQAFSQHQHGKLSEDLADKSMRLLDVCSITRDLVSQGKENARYLQSSLRRRKGESNSEASIAKFSSFNKMIKKEAKRLVLALKKVDHETHESSILLAEDQQLSAIVRTLREANSYCISIFQMLLSFLSVPLLKPKPSKCSLVSRLVHKGRIACEGQEENTNLGSKLETLEAQLETIENGLEGTFRCLIRSRSSLLNVFSC